MRQTLVFILCITIVFFLADTFGFSHWLHEAKWYMLAFFSALSYLLNTLSEQGKRNNREKFIQFYMISMGIRFLACAIFVAVYLYLGLENKAQFLINFFVLYLCFTAFEIYLLSANLRRFS